MALPSLQPLQLALVEEFETETRDETLKVALVIPVHPLGLVAVTE